jgi:Domain of unknown function (DUF5615)
VKLLLDEMLDSEIAVQLRRRGWDVEAIQGDPALEGRTDADVLRGAREAGRILVTENVRDFARQHRELIASGEVHCGLLFTSRRRLPRSKGSIGLWVDTIDRYLRSLPPDSSLENSCAWLR